VPVGHERAASRLAQRGPDNGFGAGIRDLRLRTASQLLGHPGWAVPSIGSIGDSYDNALAVTINGFYTQTQGDSVLQSPPPPTSRWSSTALPGGATRRPSPALEDREDRSLGVVEHRDAAQIRAVKRKDGY
jgi:hypothetical protein